MGYDKTILIVEDDSQDREIISKCLKEAGFEKILTAETGEAGVEKAKNEKPTLIITDTRLPGMNGFEVCETIKKDETLAEAKVIIMTGQIDAVDAVKAKRVNANDYCVKTADCESLLEAIRTQLGLTSNDFF